MILNVWTVSALFLASVGFVLAAAAAITGLRCLAAKDGETRSDRVHLLALVVVVLALVRAIAWPHFYLLLESYVEALKPFGVMCTFGVTRVQPGLVLALQWLKPVVLALLAGWGALAWADAATEGAPFTRLRSVSIVPLALLAMADCVVEGIYLASDKLEHEVSCCTQLADLAGGRVSQNASPLALAGFDSPGRTLALYFVLNLFLVALAWLHARGTARTLQRAITRPVIALLALANLVIAQWAWLDVVAPRVLGLPYHHCLYEVVTRAPAMGLAAMLTIAGNGALVGAALLACVRGRAPAAVDRLEHGVYGYAALALASTLLVVAVHVI